ncbi:MAG TPA: hypothetical protein P5050_07835 [Bacteroidia bacterium]|nr:hypothetical protein [Bacteroidia bacterium]HRS59114.1 hypothetical protein [Bacteroidia bacterium]HRU69127.1 hypothetical protein [Bacteroidia bacterium]
MKIQNLFFILGLVCCLSFLGEAQNFRAGLNISAEFGNPSMLDSLKFVYSSGEKYTINSGSKGNVSSGDIGVLFKMGYQRHFINFCGFYRFFTQDYLIKTDSVSFWSVSDSVRFGISSNNFGFKAMYEYKFRLISRNLSFATGFIVNFPFNKFEEIAYKRGKIDIYHSEVTYTGLRYKLPDIFEPKPRYYWAITLNWDVSNSFSAGAIWQQSVSKNENDPKFMYGIQAVYTLPLYRTKNMIYRSEKP